MDEWKGTCRVRYLQCQCVALALTTGVVASSTAGDDEIRLDRQGCKLRLNFLSPMQILWISFYIHV